MARIYWTGWSAAAAGECRVGGGPPDSGEPGPRRRKERITGAAACDAASARPAWRAVRRSALRRCPSSPAAYGARSNRPSCICSTRSFSSCARSMVGAASNSSDCRRACMCCLRLACRSLAAPFSTAAMRSRCSGVASTSASMNATIASIRLASDRGIHVAHAAVPAAPTMTMSESHGGGECMPVRCKRAQAGDGRNGRAHQCPAACPVGRGGGGSTGLCLLFAHRVLPETPGSGMRRTVGRPRCSHAGWL